MQTKIYLKPILSDGKPILIDLQGKKFNWPTSTPGNARNVRLCDAAIKNDNAVKVRQVEDQLHYGTAPIANYIGKDAIVTDFPLLTETQIVALVSVDAEQQVMLNFIHNESVQLKPQQLIVNDLKWKYLMRSTMRGKNIMMTGPAGCGKTMAAKSVVAALDRPDFYFNLGATQDPRATLIGNTHFNKEDGTYFSEALFVKAIQTPNAVILLDELSRAHPDAANILMTVLDEGQRYLRLDEADGSPTIKVAEGVTFIATANIGNEYTATRVMDRALMDRFIVIEMDLLSKDQELNLLQMLFPNVQVELLDKVASIVGDTRTELQHENPRISTHISTRGSVEMAGLIFDGFTMLEAAEVIVYPNYDATGGLDSERTFMKQIVQKYADDGSSDDLFNIEDEATEDKQYTTAS
jgi:nitric oxide reductase NorQ protein|tara:strand:- start:704 stop:1930 length:1227 start_codon:yes stop_codon:yes gene_type:complete